MLGLRDYLHHGQSDREPLSTSGSIHSFQCVDNPSLSRSSSSSSYYSVNSQPHAAIDEDEDAEDILAFIAVLDAASDSNETGWTYETACLALDEKRSRRETDPRRQNPECSPFNFFSHFDPTLRTHLHDSYDRRKRWGYTGDTPQGLSLDLTMLRVANAQDLMHTIQAAIDVPARESDGQVSRRREREDMERENLELNEYDQRFEGTWKGVLNSTITLRVGESGYFAQTFTGQMSRWPI
jgi:hypothetical protein